LRDLLVELLHVGIRDTLLELDDVVLWLGGHGGVRRVVLLAR
jgi:hypothetical protein